MTRAVRRIALACTIVDLAALLAHVLELPNKLALDGPLWLAVLERRRTTWTAALCLTLALATFFAVVQPVNLAFARWTPGTLPADWPRYRLRWELGHLVRAGPVTIALGALVRAALAAAQGPSGCGGTERR